MLGEGTIARDNHELPPGPVFAMYTEITIPAFVSPRQVYGTPITNGAIYYEMHTHTHARSAFASPNKYKLTHTLSQTRGAHSEPSV